ncbi:uncharacterized protein LOC134240049 [Saccostrea cucullata]|uniref:uncharacterized protein LOC134240049 n=1 Tax=Saccostrea cuccullata TaxID=36930 RepID=UPI002ED498DE
MGYIMDVMSGYVVAAFLTLHNMKDMQDKPASLPVFSLMDENQKKNWIYEQADFVMDCLGVKNTNHIEELRENIKQLDIDCQKLCEMKDETDFQCALCGKHYLTEGHFRNHLKKKHQFQFHECTTPKTSDSVVSSFLKLALLLHDTCDAYRIGDGERCLRNSKFEYLYAGALGHTKYKLWLWRYIAYIAAILSPRESFEYKWNICQNLMGGVDQNIPNDNCVELQIKKIKTQLNTQGANKSFNSAKVVTMSTQVIDTMEKKLMQVNNTVKAGRKRPEVDKSTDITRIAECLLRNGHSVIKDWPSFSKFKDPLSKLDPKAMHHWIGMQKKIASKSLQ